LRPAAHEFAVSQTRRDLESLVVCHNLTVAGIDELRFSSSGGVNAGFGFSGEHFMMDNMSFNQQQVVPER
jgi:hypothetical protein